MMELEKNNHLYQDQRNKYDTHVWKAEKGQGTDVEDPRKNAEGYFDPTAYEAIKKIEDEARVNERFNKCIHTIFHVCELAGFTLEGRVRMVDRVTGKVFE